MIVILLILAGITIATLGGENGLFARAKQAKEETQKETATEQINLIISDVYVKSYAEKQEDPTLQDLADGFCNAEGTEYVDIQTRNVSTLETVDITGYTAIYVKLEKYPYEFKIDDTLKIASIDGVEVSNTTGNTNNGDTSSEGTDTSGSANNSSNSNFADSEEYQEMLTTMTQMQTTIAQLQEKVSKLETSGETATSGQKEILWNDDGNGTRSVDINKNVSEYDFIIVYYHTVNSIGDLVFDTSEDATYKTNYTLNSSYVIAEITLNKSSNNISMSISSNSSSWSSTQHTYLLKIVGIKL